MADLREHHGPMNDDDRLILIMRGLVGDQRRRYLKDAEYHALITTIAQLALRAADHAHPIDLLTAARVLPTEKYGMKVTAEDLHRLAEEYERRVEEMQRTALDELAKDAEYFGFFDQSKGDG